MELNISSCFGGTEGRTRIVRAPQCQAMIGQRIAVKRSTAPDDFDEVWSMGSARIWRAIGSGGRRHGAFPRAKASASSSTTEFLDSLRKKVIPIHNFVTVISNSKAYHSL